MLSLSVPKVELSVWMPIFGNGIGFPIASDTRLNTFLRRRIGIQPEYLEHRIQTILVNGRAIDEARQVQLANGDVVALSAAMPGLVGTTLRMGSHLAEMRRDITYSAGAENTKGKQKGVVTLKLFNMVAKEIGPKLLDGPVLLKQKDLQYLSSRFIIVGPLPSGNITDDWERIKIVT
jgi:hypothetical protein